MTLATRSVFLGFIAMMFPTLTCAVNCQTFSNPESDRMVPQKDGSVDIYTDSIWAYARTHEGYEPNPNFIYFDNREANAQAFCEENGFPFVYSTREDCIGEDESCYHDWDPAADEWTCRASGSANENCYALFAMITCCDEETDTIPVTRPTTPTPLPPSGSLPPGHHTYFYQCGDLLYAFDHDGVYYCPDESGAPQVCGHYQYGGPNNFRGEANDGFKWETEDVWIRDNKLLAFRVKDMPLPGGYCYATSLNWRAYAQLAHYGVSCPIQNFNPLTGFWEEHDFKFGVSGDVTMDSYLYIGVDTLIRRSMGVYEWFGNGTVAMYFGSLYGRVGDQATITGVMDNFGELQLPAYTPSGPCLWYNSGGSLSAHQLPRTN